MSEITNNNMDGKNQYIDCPSKGDEIVNGHLREYHRRGITSRKTISKLLLADHGVQMSETTVARRRKGLGLMAAGFTTNNTPEIVKRQLVLDAMSTDPTGGKGPRTIREGIVGDTGVLLTRKYITEEMMKQAPDGFAAREPTAKKVHREPLVSLGPHHEWSGDGHDKLSALGFPIWGVRDKWSGCWLGLWVVRNNRLKLSIAWLYLDLIEKLGGMSIQMTTDCGSELGKVFELANSLRELFGSHLSIEELPAHVFLQSVHNITIERGWLRLRLQWGDNVKVFYEAGVDMYNPNDTKQKNLVRWIWPLVIQQDLDNLRDKFNNHVVRYDAKKKLPSGVSPNIAISLCGEFGGTNCILPVDPSVVCHLKSKLGSRELIEFVTEEYEENAKAVFHSLGVEKLTLQNAWDVFSAMLPLM